MLSYFYRILEVESSRSHIYMPFAFKWAIVPKELWYISFAPPSYMQHKPALEKQIARRWQSEVGFYRSLPWRQQLVSWVGGGYTRQRRSINWEQVVST